MSERYYEGGWGRDAALRGFQYFPAGYYDEAAQIEPSKILTDIEARQLLPLLEDGGFIKPRLDERLRTEDLKITHRLLDLLDKAVTA